MYKNQKGWIDKDGYLIYCINRKKVRAHRLAMENFLGRKLLPTEPVHHKDHNKLNNEISNLELMKDFKEHKLRCHPGGWNKGKVTINKHKCLVCKKKFETIRQPKRVLCSLVCTQIYATQKAAIKNTKTFGCKVDKCKQKHAAKGWCKKHYYQLYYPKSYTSGAYKQYLK